MPASPSGPDDVPNADHAVARAAALDDYLGGFAAPERADATPWADLEETSDADVAGIVDTILLLRQAAAAEGVVPDAPATPMPRSIGRHAILRPAGEGGFATVWEGFDTLLRRPVAVKVRRPEALLSETARRRFVREAEIAARLVHPHIVTIFEVGEDRGREFIAAEFCRGGSLASWLERHPGALPPRVAARLVRALAGAVAAAHDAGVIHRDIKPANVLLAPAPPGMEPILRDEAGTAGGDLTVKLADFGLGKVQEDGAAADPLTQLTRTGASIGTPAWMAPEQIDRSFGAVGPTTDVHALGLLLDRLLTGRALRSGGTTAETYRQVLVDDAPAADRVTRGVPRDLAAIGLKCLAKRPTDRYPSAAALADDLDRWLDGRPTVARPLSPAGRAARWLRRRPIVAALGAAAVTASIVAALVGAERARQQQELRRQSATAELRRGFEALHAGNVQQALEKLAATRAIDPVLADSLAGRWLLRRTHGERDILLAPPAAAAEPARGPRDLYALAVSPDAKTAAVAAADGTVRLIRGLDATPAILSVAAHDEVNDVAFSPDGALLASAGQDGRLRWWTVTESGLAPAGEAAPGAGALYAAAFAADGRTIAVGGEDRVVRLVRLDAADEPVELFEFEQPPGKSPEVESVAFVDDRTLAAACGDLVVLVDTVSGRLIRECDLPYEHNRNAVLGSLTVSPAGDRFMACGTDARAHVWDVATGKLVLSLPTHPAWVQGCCFVAEGDRVATVCRDGNLRIFDATSGVLLNRNVGHVGRIWSVTAEPGGTLLTCGADGTVRRWNPNSDFGTDALRLMPDVRAEVDRIIEGPSDEIDRGSTVITSDFAGELWKIRLADGSARQLDKPRSQRAVEIALDGSGRRLAVSWIDGRSVDVIDLDHSPPGVPVPAPVPGGFDPGRAIPCWTRAGDLVICSRHGKLGIVSRDLARFMPVASSLEDPVHALAFAPTGAARVAAAGKHSAVVPLPDVSGSARAAPPVEFDVGEETSAVAWSPDARLVAFGTRTGRVLFFDPATGTARGTLVPHERAAVAVAFSRDGRVIMTADEACVRISDATTRTTLDELRPGWELRAVWLAEDDGCVVLGGVAWESDRDGGGRLAVLELDRP